MSWNQDKSPSNTVPAVSPLLYNNHCSYDIRVISFSSEGNRSRALFPYNLRGRWLLHLLLPVEQTNRQPTDTPEIPLPHAKPHSLLQTHPSYL